MHSHWTLRHRPRVETRGTPYLLGDGLTKKNDASPAEFGKVAELQRNLGMTAAAMSRSQERFSSWRDEAILLIAKRKITRIRPYVEGVHHQQQPAPERADASKMSYIVLRRRLRTQDLEDLQYSVLVMCTSAGLAACEPLPKRPSVSEHTRCSIARHSCEIPNILRVCSTPTDAVR